MPLILPVLLSCDPGARITRREVYRTSPAQAKRACRPMRAWSPMEADTVRQMLRSRRITLDPPRIMPFSRFFDPQFTRHKRCPETCGVSAHRCYTGLVTNAQPSADGRSDHNARQAAIFNRAVEFFLRPIPAEIEERTARIVAAAALAPAARVLDVGSGVGVLIRHLQAGGASHIVACDLSEQMLANARERHGDAIEYYLGDIIDFPGGTEPFDAVFFNAVFGNVYDPYGALSRARALLRVGGKVILSHPMGRAWHTRLREQNPEMVPRDLPDREETERLFERTRFDLRTAIDEPDIYLMVGEARG
jgi:SAM-dependent methyltransferase